MGPSIDVSEVAHGSKWFYHFHQPELLGLNPNGCFVFLDLHVRCLEKVKTYSPKSCLINQSKFLDIFLFGGFQDHVHQIISMTPNGELIIQQQHG